MTCQSRIAGWGLIGFIVSRDYSPYPYFSTCSSDADHPEAWGAPMLKEPDDIIPLINDTLGLPVAASTFLELESYRTQAEAMTLHPDDRKYVVALCNRLRNGASNAVTWPTLQRQDQVTRPAEKGDWIAGYFIVGYVLGVTAGVITFVSAYIWCVAEYGFLFGLGLGWLPSMILAYLVGAAMFALWGPAIACLGAIALMFMWLAFH